MVKSRVAACVLAALVSAPASAGEVHGTVSYAGPPVKATPLATTKDQGTCGTSVPDESVVVEDGRLRNVVVTVKGAPRPAPGQPVKVVLDQARCRYVPHVQAAAVGTPIDIVNSDPVLHNTHGYLGTTTTFNLAMPLKGQRVPKRLDRAGVVSVRCDVHSWMSAYIVVTDAPFAVSGAGGRYVIEGVPPGTYTISAWHEKLGERTVDVIVPASGSAAADFAFGG